MGYYIEVERGVKLYVEDIGEGVPVLMVHGWPLDHRMYEYQAALLPAYGYRCIQVDLRGFGKSDRPWHGYDYDRLADDLLAVMQALQLRQVRLIGFSMGGAVVTRYMSRHRGWGVDQLILIGAATPRFTPTSDFPYGTPVAEVDKLIKQAYTDRPQLVTSFGELLFANPVSQSFRDWVRDQGFAASVHSMACTLYSLRDSDLRPDLPCIHVPTWILHGKLDRVCPFPLAIQTQKGIPGSKLIPFERSGHGVFYEGRPEFNSALLNILSPTSPGHN
ncbi:alpha/beta fold hydrolase [Paenibacillus sp. BJ-4]|uniref:alpha/beta fold hydrolase n=1 Tax=Paenibacillus sp. BJ-4 TaxID=2878097 RepID=UPI001CF04A1B|nr:alpha/beta hydrolase [Paenibacillus sp. BJ-4]